MHRIIAALLGLTAFSSSNVLAADLTAPLSVYEQPAQMQAPTMSGIRWAGTLEGYAGYTFWTSLSGQFLNNQPDTDYAAFGGAARLNVPLHTFGSAQLDLEGEATTASDPGLGFAGQYKGSVTGAGHLSWRDPARGLLGVFGGAGRSQDGVGFVPNEDYGHFWFVGLEGQHYGARHTLYGQVGHFSGLENDTGPSQDYDYMHDAWFVRGIARYFPDDNRLIEGELSFASGKQDGPGTVHDMSVFGWGVRYEHLLAGMQMNGFLSYEGAYYDAGGGCGPSCDDGAFAEHALMAGLRWNVHGLSLYENDRYGATLDLPNIGRWVTHGETLD